jgi:hypothetical protein
MYYDGMSAYFYLRSYSVVNVGDKIKFTGFRAGTNIDEDGSWMQAMVIGNLYFVTRIKFGERFYIDVPGYRHGLLYENEFVAAENELNLPSWW